MSDIGMIETSYTQIATLKNGRKIAAGILEAPATVSQVGSKWPSLFAPSEDPYATPAAFAEITSVVPVVGVLDD